MDLFEYMQANPGITTLLALMVTGIAAGSMVTIYSIVEVVLNAVKYK